MTIEQLHSELIAELRLQGCFEQADAFEIFGSKDSEHFLAGVGMTLRKAVEKLRIRPVLISLPHKQHPLGQPIILRHLQAAALETGGRDDCGRNL